MLSTRFQAHKSRFLNQWHARAATRTRAQARGFVSAPEPRTIGSFARGRQLIAGNLLFSGNLIEAPDAETLWDVATPDLDFARELHGFAWMDDLAAVGDIRARTTAQRWLWGWIDQFGKGRGIGWTPDLTGRRLIRWINHALFLLRGTEHDKSDVFYRSLVEQTNFLSRRWQGAAPGLPRFEALTGLI